MEKFTVDELKQLLLLNVAAYILSFSNESLLPSRKLYYLIREEFKTRVTENEFNDYEGYLKETARQFCNDGDSIVEMAVDFKESLIEQVKKIK